MDIKNNIQMVSRPDDPERTEENAPSDHAWRLPSRKRVWTWEETQVLIKKTEKLKSQLARLSKDAPIVIISTTEDEDIKHYAIDSLMSQGYDKLWISEPDPRFQWVENLDPNWNSKFFNSLKKCTIAIYTRRPGSKPDNATKWELQTLKCLGKKVVIYEVEIQLE